MFLSTQKKVEERWLEIGPSEKRLDGFIVDKIFGQNTYVLDNNGKIIGLIPEEQMTLHENDEGQFTVYVAHKDNKHI